MLSQSQNKRLYKRFKDEYDSVHYDVMENGYGVNGKYQHLVEQYIKKVTGRKFVHVVNNGTTAIQIAILACDLVGKKTQLSSFGFNACVSPFVMTGKPLFNDVLHNTNMDFDLIAKSVDCVMPVDWFGVPCDYDKLAKKWKGKVIVDSSQSFGATYKGKPCGSFGDISIFAFGNQKHFGVLGHIGAIATDNKDLDYKINCAINQGKYNEGRYDPHQMLGINGHCNDITAGHLWVGIRHHKEFQKRRDKIANYWSKEFKNLKVELYDAPSKCQRAWYRFVFNVDDQKHFISYCNSRGIDCRNTYPDNWNDIYGDKKPRPMTDKARKHGVSLPLSAQFTDAEVEKISAVVKEYFI